MATNSILTPVIELDEQASTKLIELLVSMEDDMGKETDDEKELSSVKS